MKKLLIVFLLGWSAGYSCDADKANGLATGIHKVESKEFPFDMDGFEIVGTIGHPGKNFTAKGPQGYPPKSTFVVKLNGEVIKFKGITRTHLVVAYFDEEGQQNAVVVYAQLEQIE